MKVAIFLILAITAASAVGQTKSTINENGVASDTDLCAILRNPQSFIGTTLTVKATYSAGFEMGWFEYPSACDIPTDKRFAIQDVWDKGYEARSEPKIVKKFHKILRDKNKKNSYLGKVVGLFEIKVRELEKTNPNDTRYQYNIVVMKVLSAEKPSKR